MTMNLIGEHEGNQFFQLNFRRKLIWCNPYISVMFLLRCKDIAITFFKNILLLPSSLYNF